MIGLAAASCLGYGNYRLLPVPDHRVGALIAGLAAWSALNLYMGIVSVPLLAASYRAGVIFLPMSILTVAVIDGPSVALWAAACFSLSFLNLRWLVVPWRVRRIAAQIKSSRQKAMDDMVTGLGIGAATEIPDKLSGFKPKS